MAHQSLPEMTADEYECCCENFRKYLISSSHTPPPIATAVPDGSPKKPRGPATVTSLADTADYQPNLATQTVFDLRFLPASTISNANDNYLYGSNRNAPRQRHCEMLKRHQIEYNTRSLPSLSAYWDEQDPAALINVLENCGKSPTLYQSRLQEQTVAGCDRRKKFDPRAPHFDVIIIDLVQSRFMESPGPTKALENLPLESLAGRPGYLFIHCGATIQGLTEGRSLLKAWQFRRIECICWLRTDIGWQEIRDQEEDEGLFRKGVEWSLLGIKGTAKRTFDTRLIHCNTHADVHISGTRPNLCYLAESFSLGLRRLYIFGSPNDLRPGWITVGRNILETTFDCREFLRRWEDRDSWLLPEDPEIEYWRPKTPPEIVRQRTRNDMKNKTTNRDDCGWGKGPFFPHPDPKGRGRRYESPLGTPRETWGQHLQKRIDDIDPPKTVMEREFEAMMRHPKMESLGLEYTDPLGPLRMVDGSPGPSVRSSSGGRSTPRDIPRGLGDLELPFFPTAGDDIFYPAPEQYTLDNQEIDGRGPQPLIEDIQKLPIFWQQPGDHPANTPSPPLSLRSGQSSQQFHGTPPLSDGSSPRRRTGSIHNSISPSPRKSALQTARPGIVTKDSLRLERVITDTPQDRNISAHREGPFSAGPLSQHPVFDADVLPRPHSEPAKRHNPMFSAFWRQPSALSGEIVDESKRVVTQ